MSEHKTPEQELKEFIKEANLLLVKLRKTLNVMLTIAGITFIPFLYSFVDMKVSITTLKENTMPEDEVYRKFVQKVDALAVHMYEDDWVRTQLYDITSNPKYKVDDKEFIIKSLFGADATRGVPK